MSERAEAWRAASAAVADMAAKVCRDDAGETHWPSVVAALGALTGEAALIACERELPLQGPVLSQRANALFYDETESPATLSGYLRQAMILGMGMPAAAAPDPVHAMRRVGASMGSRPFPPLPPDAAHWPRFWPLNAGPRLRRNAHAAMAGFGLKRHEAMFALNGALVAAILRARASLPPTAAAMIGLEAMAAALRWAPQIEEAPEEDLAYRPAGAPAVTVLSTDLLWGGLDGPEDGALGAEAGAEADSDAAPRRAFGRRRT
ncbi:hypothetical protein [Neomegalonema sp.]|uniref:hypothetical protein n=1 Tax=Neomegalonema sp. TaxID=2039713 RepID=UPI0026160F64|nr:hypothetical protein [Neomegalonema sp.]MDD2868815.1 hypothetical protein [Neomegalonema sp.]